MPAEAGSQGAWSPPAVIPAHAGIQGSHRTAIAGRQGYACRSRKPRGLVTPRRHSCTRRNPGEPSHCECRASGVCLRKQEAKGPGHPPQSFLRTQESRGAIALRLPGVRGMPAAAGSQGGLVMPPRRHSCTRRNPGDPSRCYCRASGVCLRKQEAKGAWSCPPPSFLHTQESRGAIALRLPGPRGRR